MGTKLTKKEQVKQDREQAREKLLKLLPPGKSVYTILRHVSQSGMSRHISICIVDGNEIDDITWLVARLTGDRIDRKTGGIKVTGCGMDMCFHVVYTLGRYLYPDGFKLAANQRGRNGDNSGYDKDGGYALEHRRL